MTYSLKVISSFVGVPPDTVRKWEARHGIVAPSRRPNGYRVYSEDDLQRLRRFLKLKEQGLSAAEAAEAAKRDHAEPTSAARGATDEIRKAALSFDRGAMAKIFSRTVKSGISEAFRRVWMPALLELGSEAVRKKGVWIAAEHFTTAFLRDRLLESYSYDRRPGTIDLVMSAPEGDFHELGLLMAFCRLERAKVRCLYLGPNLPMDGMATALNRTDARAAALTLTKPVPRREVKAMLAEFKKRAPRASLYVAGQASLQHANLINESGAVFLGTDLEAGIARVASDMKRGAK
jgi:DNA-binding transcriptional MerR regulator